MSLYALDDHAADEDQPAARLAKLIDGWSFARKWAVVRGVPTMEMGRLL